MSSIKETSSAEHADAKVKATADAAAVKSFRERERAKLARALNRLLGIAKREARTRAAPSLIQMQWIKTVAYLAQTYNSLLKDTQLDELREEMTNVQERLRKLTESRYQQSQTNTGPS